MRLSPFLFLCALVPLAACGTSSTSTTTATDDAADTSTTEDTTTTADVAADVTVTAPPLGYTAQFRATLANKAPTAVEEGERLFFEETWDTETHAEFPPADFLVQLWKNDPTTWGHQFANYGFLPDPNDDLPVGLKRGHLDPTRVHHVCATCHTTKLADGRLWAGMPATHLQWGKFSADVHDAWVKAGHPAYFSQAAIDHFRHTQPGSLNVGGEADPDVMNDFPMYADLHKMAHLNILGSGNDLKTEVYLSLHSFVEPAPFPSIAWADALVAYYGSLDTPQAPSPTDMAAVTRGRQVFETAKCVACHRDDLSNDTADWVDGPELLPGEDKKNHPHGTIATSPVFLNSATGSSGGSGPGPGLVDLILFIAENGLSVANPTGYVACNLHGLWTTAPYLHNGSVPTLQDLLKPAKDRATTFVRDGYTVDTTKPGVSNVGHEFGTTLPDTDKADLIAYLLSL